MYIWMFYHLSHLNVWPTNSVQGKGEESLSLRRELQERMEESKATIKKLEDQIALVTARLSSHEDSYQNVL